MKICIRANAWTSAGTHSNIDRRSYTLTHNWLPRSHELPTPTPLIVQTLSLHSIAGGGVGCMKYRLTLHLETCISRFNNDLFLQIFHWSCDCSLYSQLRSLICRMTWSDNWDKLEHAPAVTLRAARRRMRWSRRNQHLMPWPCRSPSYWQ